jgi:hypothetical protein
VCHPRFAMMVLDSGAGRGVGRFAWCEPSGGPIGYVALSNAVCEVQVICTLAEIKAFPNAVNARWDDHTAKAHWCCDEDGQSISLLVGEDDELWQLSYLCPVSVLVEIEREIARELPARTTPPLAALLAGPFSTRDFGGERFEWRVPEMPKPIQPGIDLGERTGIDGVDASRALTANLRKPVLPEHLQVLRDRGLRDAELLGDDRNDLTGGVLTIRQELEDPPSHRITENVERMHRRAVYQPAV